MALTATLVRRRAMTALALVAPLSPACRAGGAATDTATVVRRGAQIVVPPGSPLRTQLRVDTTTIGRIRQEFSATAVVEADPAHIARITPPLAGRVIKLHVRFGDIVRVGQPLVTLDAPDFATALADHQRARSALTQAQRTRDRVEDLRAHGVAAARDVEQAETDLAQARSEMDRTTARLRTLGIDPAAGVAGRTLVVRAPLAGLVEEVTTAEGEFRNDASAALMTIADLRSLWLTANVQEKDIHAVTRGQPVDAEFAAFPREHYRGTVQFVGDLLDPDTRTVKVRVVLPNTGTRYKPGMFATMHFLGRGDEAVLAPTTSVVQLRDTTYVYVEVAPWTFEPRPVALGPQQGEQTVIRSGVGAGTRVIVRGALLLQ